MMMSCVGFEVYKFSEPPLLAQQFFQSPPFGCLKIFGDPLNIFIPPPPLVILNELSLSGDDKKLIGLISKKTNCTCSTLLLLVSKKQICTCSTLFCLSLAVVLHDYNGRNCRMCLPNILFPVFMFAFIFHCRSFSPC